MHSLEKQLFLVSIAIWPLALGRALDSRSNTTRVGKFWGLALPLACCGQTTFWLHNSTQQTIFKGCDHPVATKHMFFSLERLLWLMWENLLTSEIWCLWYFVKGVNTFLACELTGNHSSITKQGNIIRNSSPISLGCRSILLRQPKLEEKMLSICRSSMLSAVGACWLQQHAAQREPKLEEKMRSKKYSSAKIYSFTICQYICIYNMIWWKYIVNKFQLWYCFLC